MAKASIDVAKLKRDIERETKRAAEITLTSLTASDYGEIGYAIVGEMKDQIGKGISPIARNGRFPAYKWANKANEIKKKAKKGSKTLKAKAKNLVQQIKSSKYPYSQQDEYPQKRERPVNLELSGKFLRELRYEAKKGSLTIGFYDDLSSEKEKGHREGANGQPIRPIIPQGDEEFSPSIYRRLVKTLATVIGRKKIKT